MIRDYYEAIRDGREVRASLIALRDAIKEEENLRTFVYLLGGDFSVLCGLLGHEDPKVRRNAALLLGKMESEDLLPVLFGAYEKEKTRFVRADYLKAMAQMDCSPLVQRFEERLEELRSVEAAPEEQKHISGEIRALQGILAKYRKRDPHRFCAYHGKEEVILVTNRSQREATARQITEGKQRLLRGGIRVSGIEIGELFQIRTWSELLFPLTAPTIPASDPEKAGKALAQSSLTEQMHRMHHGGPPYYYRIELKSGLAPDKKGSYIRKFTDAFERSVGGDWVNSTEDYEAEIRLLERKDGTFAPLLKLYTLPDRRFAYREEFLASSIAPVNAALTAELARPWLKEGAQVLDPFCGVGTMLIERAKAVPAGMMYGLDIFGEAVGKAHRNTERAGLRVNYVNRDFFTFSHEYLFDEVITDMPQVTKASPREKIRGLYLAFFEKIRTHLKNQAVLVLYATEPGFVQEALRRDPSYRLEDSFLINEKNGTEVLVLRYHS